MANKYLTVGSRFKPFTYDELLKPVMMATEAQNAMETEYSTLASQADIWKNMANKETSPVAYNLYQTFSENLNKAASSLASEGLNPNNQQSLYNLRKLYTSNITPIEQAYKQKQTLFEEQRKIKASDPTAMFDVDMGLVSLDDLLNNKITSYTPYSGSTITKQVAEAAKQLSSKIQQGSPEWKSILGGQYWQSKIKTGYTPEQIFLTAQNDPNAPKELTSIITDVLKANNVDPNNSDLYNRLHSYALLGLREVIGDEKIQIQDNKQYDYSAKLAFEKAKAAIEIETEKKKLGLTADNGKGSYIPLGVSSYDPNFKQVTKDYNALEELLKNPSSAYIDEASAGDIRVYDPKGERVAKFNKLSPNKILNPKYKKAIENLSKKYGLNLKVTETTDAKGHKTQVITGDIEKALPLIQADITKNVKRNSIYKLNMTNTELASSHMLSNIIILEQQGATPLRELNSNGSTSKVRASDDDIAPYFNSQGTYSYVPNKGIIYTGIIQDKKGKTDIKEFILEPELFGVGTVTDQIDGRIKNKYQSQMNLIDRLIKDEDYDEAEKQTDSFMGDMYNYFNTMAKTQSKTDSKIE